jgi:hypothetical protein
MRRLLNEARLLHSGGQIWNFVKLVNGLYAIEYRSMKLERPNDGSSLAESSFYLRSRRNDEHCFMRQLDLRRPEPARYHVLRWSFILEISLIPSRPLGRICFRRYSRTRRTQPFQESCASLPWVTSLSARTFGFAFPATDPLRERVGSASTPFLTSQLDQLSTRSR